MPIPVRCGCGASYTLKEEYAGQTLHCPNCNAPLLVGQPVSAAAPAPQARPIPRPNPVAESGVRRLSFHGDGGTLFGLHLKNLLLTLVTLGIYSAWARTAVRKYLYSQLEIDQERFSYHGTGKELFIGALKAGLIFALLNAAALGARAILPTPKGELARVVVLYVGILFLIPVAMVGARRYRLSRTSWRGIRFSFRGRWGNFTKLYVPGLLLTILTLGLYFPFFQNRIRGFMVNHAYFGTTPFRFDGRGRDLIARYLLGLVLTIPTLGMYWFWYAAYRERYYWGHTFFSTAGFRSTITGTGLLGLTCVNLLLGIVSLGLAAPWLTVRTLRFVFANLWLEGPLDLAAIQQEAQAASATGEALTGFFDTGAGDMDLGL